MLREYDQSALNECVPFILNAKITHPGGLLPRIEGSSFLFSAAVRCIAWSATRGLDYRGKSRSVLIMGIADVMATRTLSHIHV